MRRIAHALTAAAALGLLALAGCGSAASDSAALAGEARPPAYPGGITLASEPAGAACVLTNAATQARIGTVTTPATVPLARSNDIVEARCSAAGRMETTALLRPVRDFAEGIHHPQPTGPTAMAQIATVLRTGSTRRYNDTTVHLPPAAFASATARDAWFADRADQMRRAAAPAIARAERAPQATIDSAETLRRYLAEDLARLDAQKAAATIEAPAAPRRR
ncbi:hypothetical protein [Roseomonas sp. HF4]|uniref:hypothetical protein n=1 Tax=Roseomonas sp. HF4 TaxID=2562313 RepID=UPI0010C0B50D|nr:hypothetical protein [Roseomonas sp. HF4]